MSVQNMKDLFIHGVQDVYYAEQRIVESLPKMADAVDSEELEQAFRSHLEETRGHVERLEKVFANLDMKPKGTKCPAIEGIIKESKEIMSEVKDKETLTAAILADAQAVEHYEIARYGTLCEWAKLLGEDDSHKLLQETLEEEKDADQKLNKIAKSSVNRRAA
ncbi:MAG: ferritin-like domain-containing protein [Acetobacterales bacterium]